MNAPREHVFVTGLGVVSAVGVGREQFRQALRQGRSGVVAMRVLDGARAIRVPYAPLPDFDFTTELTHQPALCTERRSRATTLARKQSLSIRAAILSSLEAWSQARLDGTRVEHERVALIVAGHNIDTAGGCAIYRALAERPEHISPRHGFQFLDSNHVGVLSELFDLRGEGSIVGGASASGSIGLIHATRLIQWEVADVAVVLGPLSEFSAFEQHAWINLGAMACAAGERSNQAYRPFDDERSGFVLGQACACVILESSRSATRRCARVLAEIIGTGSCLDANHLPNPSRVGEARAMRDALQAAAVACHAVGYINAHGTGSRVGDETELDAIAEVFGEHARSLWVNSTKALTGHCMNAAGVLEAVATILQLQDGFVHPNPHLERPIDRGVRLAGRQSESVSIEVALSNSFGFGGFNTSIAFRRPRADRIPIE